MVDMPMMIATASVAQVFVELVLNVSTRDRTAEITTLPAISEPRSDQACRIMSRLPCWHGDGAFCSRRVQLQEE